MTCFDYGCPTYSAWRRVHTAGMRSHTKRPLGPVGISNVSHQSADWGIPLTSHLAVEYDIPMFVVTADGNPDSLFTGLYILSCSLVASKAVAFGDLDGASHCPKDSLLTVVMTMIRPVGQIQTRLGVQGSPRPGKPSNRTIR